MLITAIADLFRLKVVGSVIILVCWPLLEQKNILKEFSQHGIRASISCDPKILHNEDELNLQGVLYIYQKQNDLLTKVNKEWFSNRYKWLIISDDVPEELKLSRYDSDIVMLRTGLTKVVDNKESSIFTTLSVENATVHFDDVYVHPRDGVSLFEWAFWNPHTGLQVTHVGDKILRRKNLKKYPLRITAPVAHYSQDNYNGTFSEYLVDLTVPDHGLRCGYGVSSLFIEMLNATEVLKQTKLWNAVSNDSMIMMLESENADLSAGVLRIMHDRLNKMDYVIPIWLFSVGFTYLAERQSSSNMYVEPFSAGVWVSCLVVGIILAVAQKMTARKREEKEGAMVTVLATWLQQDASAVPDGLSGRWTFTVLSMCSMLVHAYYTSAIVSALMSTGRGGPQSLRDLADSRYAIASEDHDFIRITMFDVETTWDDLEYLKNKKRTSKFYQDIKYGVQLVQHGTTAYHAEYHQLYPHLNILDDDDLCKIQHVDTIPEQLSPLLNIDLTLNEVFQAIRHRTDPIPMCKVMTWVTTSPRGQWTNIFRTSGAWLQETGLAKRLVSRMRVRPPPCRSALLAERVTFWDVAPLLSVTVIAGFLSLGILGIEIIFAKWSGRYRTPVRTFNSETSLNFIE